MGGRRTACSRERACELGRQYVYGAELAEMDGASFTMDRSRFSWTIYAGRRFTYYSDPDQRAIGGGNFLYRLQRKIQRWNTTRFITSEGTNLVRYRQVFGNTWLFDAGFRMVGSYPTDLTADAIWSPGDGKTSLRLAFAQKITDKDYIYDYTYDARDTDPYNPLSRLNLGPLNRTRNLWLTLRGRSIRGYAGRKPFGCGS